MEPGWRISTVLEQTKMDDYMDYSLDKPNAILSSQFNDLMRRRSSAFEGAHRLLWAVLENAIKSYFVRDT
jgi:hypothetical protein